MKRCMFVASLVSIAALLVVATGAFEGKRVQAWTEPSKEKQQQAMREAVEVARLAAMEGPFFPRSSLPEVKRLPMDSVTAQGIMDLGFGKSFLWGIDGGASEDQHFVDMIWRRNAKVIRHFPAPNQSTIADGSKSIAFARNRLWVLNFLDGLIYVLHPRTGRVVRTCAAPEEGDVTSGLGFDGVTLWYGEWDFDGVKGGALLRQVRTDCEIISSFRVPFNFIDDLEFVGGKMLVSGSDELGGPYFIYQIDPETGGILQQFDKNPCENGLAFDGRFLWSADWCAHEYILYQAP